MSAVDDLIAFLRARLDEDEAVARKADMPGIHPRGPWDQHGDRRIEDARGYVVAQARPESSEHIARWDPARVLAEVEAKRKLIELYLMTYETSTLDSDAWTIMKDAMRTLTQPYANHPDYRPEWRS